MGADARIAAVATRQRGLVTGAQLRAAGLGRGAVSHRVASGRLHRMYRGVYLVGHRAAPPLARELGAVLALGQGACLSHRSAAEVWELLPERGGPVHVTAPGRRRDREGIFVHSGRLDPPDVMVHQGIPLTAPAWTLIDLGGTAATPRELERAYAEAQVRRLITPVRLREAIGRAGRRRGVARAAGLLDAEPALTRSEAEERLLALIRAGGLPEPELNARVAGHEVDFLWRREKLVVEVDGYAFHSSRAAFERDRRRDADLQDAGLRVRRVTWVQIAHEAEALLVRLTRALGSP